MAKKSRFQELLAVEVATGSTISQAAKTIGCSESVGYHLSSASEFKGRVAELRSVATNQAVGMLSNAACKAVATLVELLSSEEPRDRLAAAKAILATLAPLTEFGELRQRIDNLEKNQLRIAK